jgi:hypothetical protein
MNDMKKMIKQFHQTKDDYQKEKIKKNTLETMQGDIEKILKEKYPEYSEKHKDDLMCEGYMAVLESLETVSPDLEEKEIVRQTKEKIECNMRNYVEAFVN